MTKTEFEKWWQDIYQKFTEDNEAIVAFEDDERVIMLDTENGKTYIYNFVESKESPVIDPVINIAVAYAHLREIDVPKVYEEPKFERVKNNEKYFVVEILDGKGVRGGRIESDDYYDSKHFDNNNYFHTQERAKEVADKINFLLKLERLYDVYCPDYKPDWENGEDKYYIFYNTATDGYGYRQARVKIESTVYFPTEKIAIDVCNELNKEL